MAKPPAHFDVIFSGTFGAAGGTSEIWSLGVSLGLGTASDGVVFPDREWMESKVAGFATAFDGLMAGVSAPTSRRRTRFALVAGNGLIPKGSDGAYIQADNTTVVSGSGVRVFPNQVALVHTLESNAAGPVGRGRFFLPLPVVGTLEADGRISDAVRDGFVTRAKTFLDAINTHAATFSAGKVSVASGGSVLKGTPPALYEVKRVGVGRTLDTMRSRRSALPEERESAALA